MSPKTYRKLPIVVEAMQLRIDTAEEVLQWLTDRNTQYMVDHDIYHHPVIRIPSRDGILMAMEHDWVIRGVGGEFYVCPNERFKREYEFYDYPKGE